MLAEERRQRLLNFVSERGVAPIGALCQTLRVSEATVRRDLNRLESEGIIRRVHGGAAMRQMDSAEPPALQRAGDQYLAKQMIGRAAAELISDGETIILTSGTTTEAMTAHLSAKNDLTVITNAINVAYQLARFPHIAVIVPGGSLRHSEMSLLGHLTEEALGDLRADKVFHGTFGLDPDEGLTGTYLLEVQTDRRLMQAAQEVIILADHTKFAQRGPVRLAPIDGISTVITDTRAPEDSLRRLRDRGIRVIRA
jgi:DeoR/GlpR family transcriptional regulator of sugar metabolism